MTKKILAKIDHTAHTIPFWKVKQILTGWYPGTARTKVTFLASGIIVEMDLNMFYSTVEELSKVNETFGIINDDHYMVMDAELLQFTAIHNSVLKAEIWKQPRIGSEPAGSTALYKGTEGGKSTPKRS